MGSSITSNVNLAEILKDAPRNIIIQDAFTKAHSVLSKYDRVMCSISGGSDSDVVLDICSRLDLEKKIHYVWFDTGMEYEATKRHLQYLEGHYGIKIRKERAIQPIPVTCRAEGVPFLSKQVSEYIMRLQRHDFDFANGDRSFDKLYAEYPCCKSALEWWCNCKPGYHPHSRLEIGWNKGLKEFLIQNPPPFKISSKCCLYAKKEPAHRLIHANGYGLTIVGVRKAEGGARSTKYKSCFTMGDDRKASEYRPIFWVSNSDKKEYCEHYHIRHSDCYEVYGMRRTGCVGCPCSCSPERELELLRKYEPKLFHAASSIFLDSYAYLNEYKRFRGK